MNLFDQGLTVEANSSSFLILADLVNLLLLNLSLHLVVFGRLLADSRLEVSHGVEQLDYSLRRDDCQVTLPFAVFLCRDASAHQTLLLFQGLFPALHLLLGFELIKVAGFLLVFSQDGFTSWLGLPILGRLIVSRLTDFLGHDHLEGR